MTTFDPHGMVTRFKVDRPLSKNEQQHRLQVKQCAGVKPHYQLSLIKLNSTFVECVDKWYSMRGFVAMGGLLFCLMTLVGLYIIILMSIKSQLDAVLAAILAAFLLLLGATIHLLTRDAFTYTHYPSGSTARTDRCTCSGAMARCSKPDGMTSTGPSTVTTVPLEMLLSQAT